VKKGQVFLYDDQSNIIGPGGTQKAFDHASDIIGGIGAKLVDKSICVKVKRPLRSSHFGLKTYNQITMKTNRLEAFSDGVLAIIITINGIGAKSTRGNLFIQIQGAEEEQKGYYKNQNSITKNRYNHVAGQF